MSSARAAASSGRREARSDRSLSALESEAVEILREGAATAERPVMLYSIGKDSAVMLHLARKAFWPASPPFPLLHIDTGWKFREMIAFRDEMAREAGMELLVHTNEEGRAAGVNPFDHGSEHYTDVMKTQALRQALDAGRHDIIFGGARRDEERSRAKERIFSLRNAAHRWEPRRQRPELWNLYNTRFQPGESLRVSRFPTGPRAMSGTTSPKRRSRSCALLREGASGGGKGGRPHRGGRPRTDAVPPGEEAVPRRVRFRTLGCWPLTAATPSEAATPREILDETLRANRSEREGRLIDHDGDASMERKKREGYF